MDQLRLLGRRDVFAILLPGTILVFVGVYAVSGVLALLRLSIEHVLDQQFLLAVALFVAAYFVGSIVRLYPVNDFDRESSEHRVKMWFKKHSLKSDSPCMNGFRKCKTELAKGDDVADVPDEFDDRLFDGWLRQVDEFPYHVWLNRMWRVEGFGGVLDFFREGYSTSMWSESKTSSMGFFNYCKLAVIGNGGALADEVVMAEGATRFFAGTGLALRMSTRLLAVSLFAQGLLVAVLTLAPRWGIEPGLTVQWIPESFHLALTLVLTFVFPWICRQIVKHFRGVRLREAETVYHAFYLYSMSHPDVPMGGAQPVSQEASAQEREGGM